MKRFLTVIVTCIVVVTSAVAQNNNLFWTMRVKVKMDKKLEWEKKAPVLMKTHYPQYTFRVYEVMTGPNTGSYFLSIGPMSYKDLDAPPVFPKGEAAAKSDGQALDAISESLEVMHYRRVEAISSMKADRKIKFTQMNFVEIRPGSWGEVLTFLTKIKEVRDKNGSKTDFDYFRPSSSGPGNSFVTGRYFEKMEELDLDEKFGELYDSVRGNNAWYKDLQDYYSNVISTSTELWVFRTDLSTPKPIAVSSSN